MRWLLLCLFSLTTCVYAAPPKDLVKVQLLADVKSIKPGSTFRLAVDFTITPGWHIYWLNPGDGGLPTKAVLDLPKGLKADPIQYPTPKTFNLDGGLTAYGYENHATLLATVHVADDYKAADTRIGCDAIWLVCKDICLAGKDSPTLSLPLGDGQADHQELFRKAVAGLPQDLMTDSGLTELSSGVILASDGKSGKLTLNFKKSDDRLEHIEYFPPPAEELAFAKPTVTVSADQATILTTFDVFAGQKLPGQTIESVLSWMHDGRSVGVNVPIQFESAMPAAK